MAEQLHNSDLEQPADQAPEERSVWTTALYWGLLVGAIVSFVAALRHWLPNGVRSALAPTARPPLELSPAGTEPGVIGPLPGEVAAATSTSTSAPHTSTATPYLSTAVASGIALPQLSQDGSLGVPTAESRKPAQPHHAPVPATQTPGLPHPVQPTRWKEPTKYIVGVGLFLAILFIIYISRSVLSIIVVGALLALIVQPIVRLLRNRLKLSKGLSIAIIYLLIIILLILIPLIVIPALISSINALLSFDYQEDSVGKSRRRS